MQVLCFDRVMPIGAQPTDPERRADLVSAVARHVEFDRELLRADLLERLEEASNEYIWERAERIVEDVIDSTWSAELEAQCEQGIRGARKDFLAAAAQCEGAAEDLRLRGRESWIAAAIRHRLAFDTAWETLDERHGVDWLECEA